MYIHRGQPHFLFFLIPHPPPFCNMDVYGTHTEKARGERDIYMRYCRRSIKPWLRITWISGTVYNYTEKEREDGKQSDCRAQQRPKLANLLRTLYISINISSSFSSLDIEWGTGTRVPIVHHHLISKGQVIKFAVRFPPHRTTYTYTHTENTGQ